jgi:hypothetical protein
MTRKWWFFLFILLGFTGSLKAVDIRKFVVGWKGEKKVEFQIAVPSTFKLENGVIIDGSTLLEFIPQNETCDDWIEIITIQESCKIDFGFKEYFEVLKSSYIQQHGCEIEKLEVVLGEEQGMPTAFFYVDKPAMKIKNGVMFAMPGKRELCGKRFIKTYIGLFNVQYTIRFDSKTTPKEQKQKLREKIEDFLSHAGSWCV